MRSYRIAILVICALSILGVLLFQIVHKERYLAPDSFTYFTMARHVFDSGKWFSYTGIDHTTGIHPGYYLLLIPFYPLFHMQLPLGSFMIGSALIALSIWLLYRGWGTIVALTVLFLFLTPYGARLSNNGMESILVFVSLSLLAYLMAGYERRESVTHTPVYIGLALGLTLVSRLDLVFVVVLLILSILIDQIRIHGWYRQLGWDFVQRWYPIALIPGVVMAAAMSTNMYFGGSLMPISGKLKSSFPHVTTEWFSHLMDLKIFILALIVSALYLGWQYRQHRSVGLYVPTMWGGTAVLWLYDGLFAAGIGAWYGTLPLFLLAFTLGSFIRDMWNAQVSWHRFFPFSVRIALCAFVAVGILGWHASAQEQDWITPHRTAAEFLATHAAPGEAAAELKDGVFAFYAHLPVYNLTGLANTQTYVKAARSGAYEPYLQDHAVKYIIGGSFGSGIQVPGANNPFSSCTEPIYDTSIVTIFPTEHCFAPAHPSQS